MRSTKSTKFEENFIDLVLVFHIDVAKNAAEDKDRSDDIVDA